MDMIAHERACAREAGEIVPSFVKLRRFKGSAGYPAAVGYYERRHVFRPLEGEAICVRPDEIEELPEDSPELSLTLSRE